MLHCTPISKLIPSPTTALLLHHQQHLLHSQILRRSFFLFSPRLSDKPLPSRLKLEDADLIKSYLKGSGPGGQKINKTNSAVQLTHKPTGIVVKSQATRSRAQNEKIARQLLADKVEQLLKGDESRVAIKADRERKKKASKSKKSRRKYRDLEEQKGEDGHEVVTQSTQSSNNVEERKEEG